MTDKEISYYDDSKDDYGGIMFRPCHKCNRNYISNTPENNSVRYCDRCRNPKGEE